MPPRDIRTLLHDIIEPCMAIESLVAESTLEQYLTDRHLWSSIEREFIIIGEVLPMAVDLDETIEVEVPETGRIIRFRNNLVHGYDKVNNEVFWEIANKNVAQLRKETGVS